LKGNPSIPFKTKGKKKKEKKRKKKKKEKDTTKSPHSGSGSRKTSPSLLSVNEVKTLNGIHQDNQKPISQISPPAVFLLVFDQLLPCFQNFKSLSLFRPQMKWSPTMW
jgi:hypothetical protein